MDKQHITPMTSYWFKNKEEQQTKNAARYSAMDYRRKLIYPARARAKARGIECTITYKDLKLPKYCPLLGIEIDYSSDKGGPGKVKPNSPSLDRIDSSKGYTPDNVWVISRRANTIKNDATLAELKMIVANLTKLEASRD